MFGSLSLGSCDFPAGAGKSIRFTSPSVSPASCSPSAMFSLLVLFTVFVGLVVILLLSEQCRRRWRGEKGEKERQQRANLARLVAWLEERGHTLPPPASVIDLLNRVARRKIQSQVRPP